MITALAVLVGLAMLATLGVLFAGVLGMAGGAKDGGRRSNLLMRWRIGLQFLAVVLFAILVLLMRQ